MVRESQNIPSLFFSYSHVDAQLRDDLEKHLSSLRRQGIISFWHDADITAGAEFESAIRKHLDGADIILLLISPDFLASEFCYEEEMRRALQRHSAGDATVIPVILRACDWKDLPCGRLLALPKDGLAVTSWQNRDEGLLSVVTGIKRALRERYKVPNQKDKRDGNIGVAPRKYSVPLKSSIEGPELKSDVISDPNLLVRRETANAVALYQAVVEVAETFLTHGRLFQLRPAHLLHLHRIALAGISSYAGNWRPLNVEIGGSKHRPPDAFQVPELIEDLCNYVNKEWKRKSPLHLCAYVLWKLNWIQPFTDGNGRISRAASYLVLCVRLGYLPPGKLTIPEQISQNKTPYYKALEAADLAWERGAIDLSAMKDLLSSMLARQLIGVHADSQLRQE